MKKLFCLFFALSIFNFCHAQKQDTTIAPKPSHKLNYGIKENDFVFLRLPNYNGGGNNNINYGVDYSAFVKYRGFGIFGGYSALINFNNHATYTNAIMNCFNLGVIYTFFQFNKTSALTLYFYNIHYSATNPLYRTLPFYNGIYLPQDTYKKEIINFIIANPRYTGTFCKGILSLEFGVFFSVFRDNIIGGITNNENSYPAIGLNGAAAINLSALFAKK